MPSPEPHLAVIGPGLLGGSLALAAKHRGAAARVSIWGRRQESIDHILQNQVADFASTHLADVVKGATLIVLATPVETMAALASQLAQLPLAPGTLITDVGSVKGSVVAQLEPLFATSAATFLGSHPMAGSEKTGLEAARGDLFHSQNAACILTPTAASSDSDLDRLTVFWQTVGCRVLPPMSPERHDEEVARVSHFPHLMAGLTTLAALKKDPTVLRCAGNGFRDTTRISAGDPSLWTGIISQNLTAILPALRDAQGQLGELLEILESLDEEKLRQFLTNAKSLRDLLPPPPSKP